MCLSWCNYTLYAPLQYVAGASGLRIWESGCLAPESAHKLPGVFLVRPGPGAFTVPLNHQNLGRNNKLRLIHHVSRTGEWQVRMNVDHEYEIIQEVLIDLPQSAQCYCVCSLRGPLPEQRWKSYAQNAVAEWSRCGRIPK